MKEIENVVMTTETDTTVLVTANIPETAGELIIPNYFKKHIAHEIPAVQEIVTNIVTTDEGKFQSISIRLVIPTINKATKKPQNTVENIQNLLGMGLTIILLILRNSSIPKRIENIAKDCKPWFNDEDNETA